MAEDVQEKADRLTREGRVVELVDEGYTMAEVAEMTGYANAGGVSKAYWRALRRYPAAQVEVHRQNENIKLDEIEANAGQIEADSIQAADPEMALKAQDRRLKVMERRAKLNGLDAPVKSEVDHKGGTFNVQVPSSRIPDKAAARLNDEQAEAGSA